MNSTKLKRFASEMIDELPIRLQRITLRVYKSIRYFVFVARSSLRDHASQDPLKVYWISPDRITYHTNYVVNKNAETVPFRDRDIHPRTLRGEVLDGDWDISDYKFTDLDVFKSFKQRIEEGVEWQDTDFYKRVLAQLESGEIVWEIRSKDDLDKRFNNLDWLYRTIKGKGYALSYNKDEIDVNIGRNGQYLFQNGVHRLSIAKILGIKRVPVRVFVRHRRWQDFREYVAAYAEQQGGRLYQPIVHPDLADVPYNDKTHDYQGLMTAIERHLEKKSGAMLDIGASLGFFCHKFEDLGYQCYAVEVDPAQFRILEKIRIAENKKFATINKSIFDVELVKDKEFEVVLALNIFHHFLKRETTFLQLIDLLKNLKMSELFFEPHDHKEDQMKGAYKNFVEAEFVDFILRHSSMTRSEIIYTAKNGRHVFKLSK